MGKVYFFPCGFDGNVTTTTFNTGVPPVQLYNQPESNIPGYSLGILFVSMIGAVALIIKRKH
jgi:hypothetical protein